MELIKETQRGKITFHERYWRKVSGTGKSRVRTGLKARDGRGPWSGGSSEGWTGRYGAITDDVAKDFIRGMLVVDPKARMSAQEALDHPVRLSSRSNTISPHTFAYKSMYHLIAPQPSGETR